MRKLETISRFCVTIAVYIARYIVSVRVLNNYRISIYRQNDKGE